MERLYLFDSSNQLILDDSISPTPTPPEEGQGLVLNVENVYERQYSSGDNSQIDVDLFGENVIEGRQLQLDNRDKEDRDLIQQVMTEQPPKQESVAVQIEEMMDGQTLFLERRVYSRSEDLNNNNTGSNWVWLLLIVFGIGIGITSSILFRKYKRVRTL